MGKTRFLWIILAVVMLLVAACAPKAAPTPTPAAPATPVAPAPPAPTPAPTPRPPTPPPATPAPPAVKLPPTLSVATAGVGTTSYIVASAFAEVIGKYTGTKVTVEPAGATARWLPLMKTKEIDFALGCGLPDVADGYYGVAFWKERGPQPIVHAATGHVQPYGFVVTDPKIKSVADLKGKKLYITIRGMRTQEVAPQVLFREAGLKPGDVEALTFADINEATKGILEGKAIGVFYLPTVIPIVELDRAKPLYGVPVTKEMADKLREEVPEFGFMTWKKGQGINKEDMPYLSLPCGMHAREDLPADVVSTFLSTIYAHYDEYKDKHPIMQWWTPEQAVTVIPLPMHPGAVRYFKEKGVWKAEQEQLQQKALARPRG